MVGDFTSYLRAVVNSTPVASRFQTPQSHCLVRAMSFAFEVCVNISSRLRKEVRVADGHMTRPWVDGSHGTQRSENSRMERIRRRLACGGCVGVGGLGRRWIPALTPRGLEREKLTPIALVRLNAGGHRVRPGLGAGQHPAVRGEPAQARGNGVVLRLPQRRAVPGPPRQAALRHLREPMQVLPWCCHDPSTYKVLLETDVYLVYLT